MREIQKKAQIRAICLSICLSFLQNPNFQKAYNSCCLPLLMDFLFSCFLCRHLVVVLQLEATGFILYSFQDRNAKFSVEKADWPNSSFFLRQSTWVIPGPPGYQHESKAALFHCWSFWADIGNLRSPLGISWS